MDTTSAVDRRTKAGSLAGANLRHGAELARILSGPGCVPVHNPRMQFAPDRDTLRPYALIDFRAPDVNSSATG